MMNEDLTASERARAAAVTLRMLANNVAMSSTAPYRRKASYAPLPVLAIIRRHAQLWSLFADSAERHESEPTAGTAAACSEALQSLLSAIDEYPGLSPLRWPALLAEATERIARRR